MFKDLTDFINALDGERELARVTEAVEQRPERGIVEVAEVHAGDLGGEVRMQPANAETHDSLSSGLAGSAAGRMIGAVPPTAQPSGGGRHARRQAVLDARGRSRGRQIP